LGACAWVHGFGFSFVYSVIVLDPQVLTVHDRLIFVYENRGHLLNPRVLGCRGLEVVGHVILFADLSPEPWVAFGMACLRVERNVVDSTTRNAEQRCNGGHRDSFARSPQRSSRAFETYGLSKSALEVRTWMWGVRWNCGAGGVVWCVRWSFAPMPA
jgi:hypothetical protein